MFWTQNQPLVNSYKSLFGQLHNEDVYLIYCLLCFISRIQCMQIEYTLIIDCLPRSHCHKRLGVLEHVRHRFIKKQARNTYVH